MEFTVPHPTTSTHPRPPSFAYPGHVGGDICRVRKRRVATLVPANATVRSMSADTTIRSNVTGIPGPDLTPTATVLDKPLSECKVAICTTAGLRLAGDVKLWLDASFTVLPAAARDVQLSHFSPNFDRSGLTADINTAYPADRLSELAEAGVIGSVATNNLSFMGAQLDATFSSIINDSGPAAAQVLLDDDVDVVIFTPV